MRLRYFFPFVAKGIENSKLMQTSSDFSSRKPIFSIQGNWQERSYFEKDVKNKLEFCICKQYWLSTVLALSEYFFQFTKVKMVENISGIDWTENTKISVNFQFGSVGFRTKFYATKYVK